MVVCLCVLQVSSRAEHLGSGLLSQGCQPSPDQFIGVFAQNRPEVKHQTPEHEAARSSAHTLKSSSVFFFSRSGSSRSWRATPTPWWWFPCTTRWDPTPSATSSTQVTHTSHFWLRSLSLVKACRYFQHFARFFSELYSQIQVFHLASLA